jgi:hypothetical protein
MTKGTAALTLAAVIRDRESCTQSAKRTILPSASQTVEEGTNLPFVIPSAAEGSAVLLNGKTLANCKQRLLLAPAESDAQRTPQLHYASVRMTISFKLEDFAGIN